MNFSLPKLVIRPALQADPGDVDLTIVLAHRGNPMGLWATVHSCEIDLVDSGLKHNYVIVVNGEEKLSREDEQLKIKMERVGKLRDFIFHPDPLSPPTARQYGTESANGKYLFFFDNHCLVGKEYFRRAIQHMEGYGMDMLHSSTRFYLDDEFCYHYKIREQMKKNFWGDAATEAADCVPYRIACGGHGGFVVRRSVWDEVGGYGPVHLFEGYGGEEMYFDLKMGMLGKTNWIAPDVIHYHFNGTRGYTRHFTADYYRNMMMCAYIIGGEKWMYKVYENFTKDSKSRTIDLFELLQAAEIRGKGHAEWLAGKRQKSLDELLMWYDTQHVAF
jgi:hypothetical protein